ncbi:carboxylesterase [Enterococcus sp. JM4C]|uniref:alpha/beta hydrolase n=1 Tax=Candidatus Enterococcus huntleyi TaxID=1857217 RepID=UPI00137A8B65|nr:alpha/beta fold hydrolase [Enterococcus sp. JM4C]KAF1295742.1 carboxylesterase [Enterococcus sp. JM4C]
MKQQINLPKPLFAPHGKRAVLLLHAYSGSSNDVRMMSRYIESADYTVYSPNFSGHGTLDPLDILTQDKEAWWQDTTAALAFLKEQGYTQIAVFGLSMGGIYAMHALELQDPAIVGGGLFCSPIFPENNHVFENFMLYAKQVMTLAELPSATIEQKLAEFEPLAEKQLAAIQETAQRASTQLSEIKVPVFLAQAGQDKMIDPTNVFKTAQALKNSRYTLQWYPESTHVITVGKDRRQLQQDVLSFLNALPWNEEKE